MTTDAIAAAVQALLAGELVAMPTETVYGLAADAGQADAVAAIYALKQRPTGHPLIVHVTGLAQARRWAHLNDHALALAARFWPGPLTLIARRRSDMPAHACAGHPTVGVRVPSHPVAQALLAGFEAAGGLGVAAPSANRFGQISPTLAQHVRDDYGAQAPLVLDGGSSTVGLESTICDVSGERPAVLRPGSVAAADIAATLGLDALEAPGGERPAAPGTHAAHYAPRTPMILLAGDEIAGRLAASAPERRMAVYAAICPTTHDPALWLPMPQDPVVLGQVLYRDMRRLDALDADCLLVERPPSGPAWAAVHDRLGRAATGSATAVKGR